MQDDSKPTLLDKSAVILIRGLLLSSPLWVIAFKNPITEWPHVNGEHIFQMAPVLINLCICMFFGILDGPNDDGLDGGFTRKQGIITASVVAAIIFGLFLFGLARSPYYSSTITHNWPSTIILFAFAFYSFVRMMFNFYPDKFGDNIATYLLVKIGIPFLFMIFLPNILHTPLNLAALFYIGVTYTDSVLRIFHR